MRSLLLVCLAGVFIAGTAHATGKERVGTIIGIVLDGEGNPAGGARVTIQESGNGDHPHAVQTDPTGRFTFERISAGGYDLRAYYQGAWSEWLRNAIVRADRETTLTLRMPASLTK